MLNDSLFALKHGCIVKGHLSGLHAPHLGFAHQVDDLGIAAKGLGGDATAVQAGATHLVTLDNGDIQSVGCGIGSGLVTARPCAYDNNVKHISNIKKCSLLFEENLTLSREVAKIY